MRSLSRTRILPSAVVVMLLGMKSSNCANSVGCREDCPLGGSTRICQRFLVLFGASFGEAGKISRQSGSQQRQPTSPVQSGDTLAEPESDVSVFAGPPSVERISMEVPFDFSTKYAIHLLSGDQTGL